LLVTAPSVEYLVGLINGEELKIDSPAKLPPIAKIAEIREPWMKIIERTNRPHAGQGTKTLRIGPGRLCRTVGANWQRAR